MSDSITDLLSSELAQRIGWMLVHCVWQGLVVALLLAVVLQMLRRSTPQARWAAACVALGLMVLLPIVTACVVSVETPEKPSVAAELPKLDSPGVAAGEEAVESVPMAVLSATSPEPPRELAVDGEAIPTAVVPLPEKSLPWRQRAADLLRTALPWAVVAWLAGVVVLSCWHLGGWLWLAWTKRRGTSPIDESTAAAFGRLVQRMGVRRPVRVLGSVRVVVPMVVGWVRPVILLPVTALTGLTSEQLEAVLAHELAHVRRCDCLVRMFQVVAETLFFYHPAVWWISSRIRQEAEYCCDELAAKVCGDRKTYVSALVRAAELGQRHPSLVTAATGGRLLPRVRRLLGSTVHGCESTHRLRTCPLVVALLAVVLPAAGWLAHVRARAEMPPAEPVAAIDAGPIPPGKAVDGLESRLSARRKTFPVGEPIPMRLELINVGSKPKDYHVPQVFLNATIVITDGNGKRVPYIGGSYQTMNPSKTLKPGGEDLLAEGNLADYYHLKMPGKYTAYYPGTEGWGDGDSAIPRSNDFQFEIADKPDTVPTGNDAVASLLELVKGRENWTLDAYPSPSRLVQPGTNHGRTPGRCFHFLHNPTGLKKDTALFRVWLTQTPAPVESWQCGDKSRVAAAYVGQGAAGHVYVEVPSEARRRWPTVVHDVAGALGVAARTKIDWGKAVGGLQADLSLDNRDYAVSAGLGGIVGAACRIRVGETLWPRCFVRNVSDHSISFENILLLFAGPTVLDARGQPVHVELPPIIIDGPVMLVSHRLKPGEQVELHLTPCIWAPARPIYSKAKDSPAFLVQAVPGKYRVCYELPISPTGAEGAKLITGQIEVEVLPPDKADLTRQLASYLKASTEEFALKVIRMADEPSPLRSLRLTTYPVKDDYPPHWTTARIDRQQADAIVDHLAAAGLLWRTVVEPYKEEAYAKPCYFLAVSLGNEAKPSSVVDLPIPLGWGAQTVDELKALRKALRGEAAKGMDEVLAIFDRPEQMPPAEAATGDPIQTTLRATEQLLPQGWSVRRDGQKLIVSRDKPVEFYNRINLPAHRGVDDLRRQGFVHKRQYSLTLRFAARIAPEAYHRLAAENAATREQMAAMQERMRHITHKFDSYLPDTPEEEKLVKAYERMKTSLHDLPDYVDDKHSIWLSDSFGWTSEFASEDVGEECKDVRGKILAQFQRYTAVSATVEDGRLEVLKKNAERLQVVLHYHGEQDKPFYNLILHGPGVKPQTPAGWLKATLHEPQAKRLIDHLIADGFLDNARNVAGKEIIEPEGPAYTLTVSGPKDLELYEVLGWGLPMLKRLDAIAKILDGDAAKSMNTLIGRMAGHRRLWEEAESPANRSESRPATREALQSKAELVMQQAPTIRGLHRMLPPTDPDQVETKWDGQWIGYVFEMSYPVDDRFAVHARGMLAVGDATGGPKTIGNGPETELRIVDRTKLLAAVTTLRAGLAVKAVQWTEIETAVRTIADNPLPEYADLIADVLEHPWPFRQHIEWNLWHAARQFPTERTYRAAVRTAQDPKLEAGVASRVYETIFRSRRGEFVKAFVEKYGFDPDAA